MMEHFGKIVFEIGKIYEGCIEGYFLEDMFIIDEYGVKDYFYHNPYSYESPIFHNWVISDNLISLAKYREQQIDDILDE